MYILNLSQNVYININLIICIFRNGNSKTYPPVIGGSLLIYFCYSRIPYTFTYPEAYIRLIYTSFD